MKKIVLLSCILAVCSVFISCGDIEVDDSETEEIEFVDYIDTFTSIDELGKFIIQNKDGDFKKLFEHETLKKNNSVLTLYEFKNIPDGFYLSDIRTAGSSSHISMDYTNEKITFVWYFADNGNEYLNNCKTGCEEIPGMPGYYYTKENDGNNTEIYRIYWTEDGYCFQLNIPVRLFDEKYENKDFMKLNKVEFS